MPATLSPYARQGLRLSAEAIARDVFDEIRENLDNAEGFGSDEMPTPEDWIAFLIDNHYDMGRDDADHDELLAVPYLTALLAGANFPNEVEALFYRTVRFRLFTLFVRDMTS
jgi:hypothetical protein